MKEIKTTSADCCASPGLLPVAQAIDAMLARARPVEESETIDLPDALGRVLAEDMVSAIDVPGYDNSAMDGYAVRSADCGQADTRLPVSQRIPAGSTGTELKPGTAARIFTGAPLPPGADAVVMQEQCERDGDSVIVHPVVKALANVRRAGEDIAKGGVVLRAGQQLRPQELGLLASVGRASLPVWRKLKVAIFFTGDEIVTPGEPLRPGQIYNSNRYTLNGLLQKAGCEIIDLGIVPDTLAATREVLQKAAGMADLVMTSGGVSVGEEDYVRIALEQLGELNMWRIAMKPGKPVAFGHIGETLFLGLPGNPVSVFATFLLFARGLIRKMQGCNAVRLPGVTVRADFDWPAVSRQEYLRARRIEQDGETFAHIYPHQGSGVLSSASWADGLVEIPIGKPVNKGDPVRYFPFEGMW